MSPKSNHMTAETKGQSPNIVEKGLMWLFSAVVAVMSLIFIVGGIYLATLGGSLYYVIAGAIFLVSAILLFTGKRLGAWVFGAALAITIAWSLWEVGFDGWSLMPRLMIPVAFGIWLLLPWLLHQDGRVHAGWLSDANKKPRDQNPGVFLSTSQRSSQRYRAQVTPNWSRTIP